ncbi:MAG: ATP-binding protein [Acidimicrobiales bacterium]
MTASVPPGIVPRRVLEVARARMDEEPVLALHGPRTVGKSTLLAELARSRHAEVLDLDDPALREAVRVDPTAFVTGPGPIFVDEYQHAPVLLDAIKAELNRDLRPGRFVLTGSTRYDALPIAAQALTGRLHLLTVWPLSQAEIGMAPGNLLEALLTDPSAIRRGTASSTTREDYVARVCTGGFPIPLTRRSIASRNRWFDDYVQLVLERDVRELARVRQREQLPALLRRFATQTAQVLNVTTAAGPLGVDRTTAADYLRLLEAVFLVFRLPAWGTSLRARVSGSPKLHVLDPGVAARLLRIRPDKLARRDATSLTDFGHLLETFVVSELMKQASWLDDVAAYGHWRTHDGDEIDLVVELGDGSVVGFEVKAAGRVTGDQMRSLAKLREALGERFIAGVVLYTGARSYEFGERLLVLPVDRLWAPLMG